MKDCVLITGGAGFIGTSISHLLADTGSQQVVVFDNMHPQIHQSKARPQRLHPRAELIIGDVTRQSDWDALLEEWVPVKIFHLAAETGTGQSLTESTRHGMVNVVGTTQMLDALSKRDIRPEKLVLTSSRAVYGEGRWVGKDGRDAYPGQRSVRMLSAGEWDFADMIPMPSLAENTFPAPTSIYGATKLDQEHLLSAWSNSFDVPLSILRLQNVYGEGQSLTNSYTGIVSLFCRMAYNGEVIPVYEDGNIVRDFVHIDDVASAIVKASNTPAADGAVLDVGTGVGSSILDLANTISGIYSSPAPQINGKFRNGDVRNASTNIERTSSVLNWSPTVTLDMGIRRLSKWIEEQGTDVSL